MIRHTLTSTTNKRNRGVYAQMFDCTVQ